MEALSALLVSNDPGTLGIARKVLEEHGFIVRLFSSVAAAELAMRRARFDLAVCDTDLPDSVELIKAKNAPKMVFAVVQASNADSLQGKRVHFMLQKPFSADLFGKSLRAAYGSMLRERRSAFRHRISLPATSCVQVQDNAERPVGETTILDMSQTGCCLQTRQVIPQGTILQINVMLPDTKASVVLTGTVIWNQASGKAGVQFNQISDREQINAWLDSLQSMEPDLLVRTSVIPRSPDRSSQSLQA